MPTDVTKLTVNLPSEAVEHLKQLARRRGRSVTEMLLSAIELQAFLAEKAENGNKLVLAKPDQTMTEVVFPSLTGTYG